MSDAKLPRGRDWNRWAAFLDFDGTLAPIRARPEQVALAARERRLLERLRQATGGAVAVITGRALDDIRAMTAGLELVLIGSHGVETFRPGAKEQVPAWVAAALDAPYRQVAAFAAAHGLLVERKPGAVALHYRGHETLQEGCCAVVDRAVAAAEARTGRRRLRALHGSLVSEVAVAGFDKGTALRDLMALPPFKGRRPLMAGDDTTDEDGIRTAQTMGGIGLRIGGIGTAANVRFDVRDEFIDWLESSLQGI